MRRTFLVAVVLGVACAAPAHGAVVNVNCAKHDLQAKIDAAPPGWTLRVKGTCVGRFTVDKNLTLDGSPKATLDAAELGRTLTIAGAPTVRLLDLTVTGGRAVGSPSAEGGGIRHPGGELTLRRVVVAGNTVAATAGAADSANASGGGLWSDTGSLKIFSSTVRGNVASASAAGEAEAFGGGIYRFGNLTLDHARVSDNRAAALSSESQSAGRGGGLHIENAVARIVAARIDGNRVSGRLTAGPGTSAFAGGGGMSLSQVSELTLRGSTVSSNRGTAAGPGGAVQGWGGGIYGFASEGTVRNTVFAGNELRARSSGSAVTSARGGGLAIGSSDLTIRDSRVIGSVVNLETNGLAAGQGGGLWIEGDLTVLTTRVGGNTVDVTGGTNAIGQGGGIFIETGTHTIERSTIDSNRIDAVAASSSAYGGGIDVNDAIILRASTVSRNVATAGGQSLGGGIEFNAATSNSITNSTIAGNRAIGVTARGGGVDSHATLTVTNSTLARNRAKLGGGLYVGTGPTTLQAAIIGSNVGTAGSPDCGGPVASLGRNLIAKTAGCMFTHLPSDKRNVAPRLGALGANGGPTQTIPLRPGSPALNAIPENECAVATDQRGVRRPQGPRCEIGAYEQRPRR